MVRCLVTLALLFAAVAAKDERTAEVAANDITVKVERRFLVDTKDTDAAEAAAEQPAGKDDERQEKEDEEEGQGTQPEHRQRYVVPKAAFMNPGDHNETPDDDDVFVRHDVVELPLLNKSLEFDVYESWMPGPLLPSWAVAVLMSVFGLIMLFTFLAFCWFGCLESCRSGLFNEIDIFYPSSICDWTTRRYDRVRPCADRERPNVDCVYGEASWALLAPWLAVLLLSLPRLVVCGVLVPLQQLLLAILVLRACFIDWCFRDWAREKGGGIASLVGQFFLSKLEISDAISDGMAVSVALRASAATRLRWAASFPAPAAAHGALAAMGPGFALGVALAFSSFIQWTTVAALVFGEDFVASIAGLGLASIALERPERHQKESKAIALTLLRILGEAAPQLLLQTALLAASGESLAEQPEVALSVALSCAMLLKGAVALVLAWGDYFRGLGAGGMRRGMPAAEKTTWYEFVVTRLIVWLVTSLFTLPLVAMAALAILRLVGVEACASRTWTLAGGCLPPSALVV